jgi:tRNA threonylcarbamoyladenosine biosynthesis protein TsaB
LPASSATSPGPGPGPGPILAICAAEPRLCLALCREGRALSFWSDEAPGRANEVLAPALRRLLADAGLRARDLGGVACVRGPGSFTGLRMSLALCLGLARAAGLPLAGLDHLPLLAAGAAPGRTGTLLVLTHSRARQVYAQAFAAPTAAPLGGPVPASLEQVPALLAGRPRPWALAGSGALKHQAELAALLPEAAFLGPEHAAPQPEALTRAAEAARYSLDPIAPLYLRASDAEDNLGAIAAARGLDPGEAARRLGAATGAPSR